MLATAQIMAFTATSNAAEATLFYRDVLGLTMREDSPYAVVFDANGIMLRIQKVEEHEPAAFTVLGWMVSDIVQSVAELATRGVVFERYSFVDQDAAGVWTTPDGSRVAWFLDPDGNTLSLTQMA